MAARTSSLVHPKYKTKYSVSNWREYEQGLRAALLHESNSTRMLDASSLSVSDRLRLWCPELEHTVEYVAGESNLGLLIAWVA